MAFNTTAIPLTQIYAPSTTTQTAESLLYTLCLYIVAERDFNNMLPYLCQATQISNFLFALNDPNISQTFSNQILLSLNNISTPYNQSVYPQLKL
mgnify:CR=1 FL=1